MKLGIFRVRGSVNSRDLPLYEPGDVVDSSLRMSMLAGIGAFVLQDDFAAVLASSWPYVCSFRVQRPAGMKYALPACISAGYSLYVSAKVRVTISGVANPAWVNGTWLLTGRDGVFWRSGPGTNYLVLTRAYQTKWQVLWFGGPGTTWFGPDWFALPDGSYTSGLSPGATCIVAGGEASWWDQP